MGRKTGESSGPGPGAAVPWEVGAADSAGVEHPLRTPPPRSAPPQGAPARPAAPPGSSLHFISGCVCKTRWKSSL